MTPNARALMGCLVAAALFGASVPASKALVGPMGPLTLAGLLYAGAAVGVLPRALRDRASRPDARNLRLIAGAVIAGGILGPVLYLAGLARAPAASVSLWLNMETAATAVLGLLVFREHVGRSGWIAALLVIAGGVVLASPGGFAAGPAALLVALACVAWGFDNHVTALIDRLSPAQSTLVKGVVAGAVNLGLGLWAEGSLPGLAVIAGALAVGALGYGLSIALYIGSAQQLGATRAQMVFATAPFWGVAIAWGVTGETIRIFQVAAALLMAAALVVLHRERHAHRHTHEARRHTHPHRHDDAHHTHTHPGLPAHVVHTHEHSHEALVHDHPHRPDLHHRHDHD